MLIQMDDVVIDVKRLKRKADFAKVYIKKDGSVGVSQTYIENLIKFGELKTIEISGVEFILMSDKDIKKIKE